MITRPAADAVATAERVRRLGWVPVVAPVLEIETLEIGRPGAIDGIVVTSGNALASVSDWAETRLLCVGDATAERARGAGFLDVRSAGGDATALAAVAARHFGQGARLLFPTAEGEGIGLAEALRGAGFGVDRRLGYAVRPVGAMPEAAVAALEGGRVHAALFLSARTAGVFAGLVGPPLRGNLVGIDALAIGAAAADALTLLPWRRVRVSLGPTLDQVLALL